MGHYLSIRMTYKSILIYYSVGVGKTLGVQKIAVPTQCWKVIYIKKTKEHLAYLFNNTTDKPTGVNSHKVEVKDIEKLTHLKFK